MDIPEGERLVANQQDTLVSLIRALMKSEDPREQERLQRAFYGKVSRRFYDRLRKPAFKLIGGIPDWEVRMEEVFDDTFIIAFKALKTFKVGSGWDETECLKVVLNWMSKIANNLFLDLATGEQEKKEQLDKYSRSLAYDFNPGEDQKRSNPKETYDKPKFDAFWRGLNPMSQEILLLCIKHDTIQVESGTFISDEEAEFVKVINEIDTSAVPKKLNTMLKTGGFKEQNKDHLPEEALKYLESKYEVDRPAIRKAKQRALEGLRKCKT
jgi:DNA-directed RNA polymerase specialized sigma24 family protein